MEVMKNNKPLNFIVIGRSGCGKGTQAKLLMEKFRDMVYVYTGELFRDLSKRETDAGLRIRKILNEGGLPFDELASTLWMHKIAYTVKSSQGIMLDSSPRRLDEAKDIDKFFSWLDRLNTTSIFYIDISKKESLKRLLLRNRGDDQEEKILKRLGWFDTQVMPALDYYKSQNRLIRINGEQTVEKVFEEILSKIRS